MVTWDNYEEYLVMLADGELDAAGQKEIEAFMMLHPEVREELALYETVRFTPDTTQVFENKKSLLRSEPKGMVINLNQWVRYGAAAGMLALVGFGAMKWQQSQNSTSEIAANNKTTINTPPVKKADIPVTTITEESPVTSKEEPQLAHRQHRMAPQAPHQAVQVAKVEKPAIISPDEAPVRLEMVTTEKIEIKPDYHVQVAQVKELPKVNISTPAPEPDQSTLAWLPLDQEKKQGLNEVKDALSARLDKAKEIRNNIRNTDMAVKLGKKELFVVRF